MSALDWLRGVVQASVDAEAEAIDAALAEVVWLPPAETVVRRPEIPLGRAYVLPGTMFPDGRERTVVNPKQYLREEPSDG